MAELQTFTLVLAWGQSDEGLYHWAGQAESEDAAVQEAREEMDASYNKEYGPFDEGDPGRGKEFGEETTEYELVDSVHGVNEYAAPKMLEALRGLREFVAKSPAKDEPEIAALIAKADAAIADGQGRGKN